MTKKAISIIALLTFTVLAFSFNNQPQQEKVIYEADELVNGEFLHDFMVIGSFPNLLPEGVTDYFHLDATCLGFKKDYLVATDGEEKAMPYIGQVVKYDDGKQKAWQKIHSDTDMVDLRKVFSPNEKVVAYAAIYINSDKEQEKIMGIGSNDGMKVWFNGEMLIKVHKPRTVKKDDEYLKLKLKKGLNLLLIKIEQGFGGWGFILRPVDNNLAWKHIQENLNVNMNSEFIAKGDSVYGCIGDNNTVGQLKDLPLATVEFTAINNKHHKTLKVPVGTHLALAKKDFPAKEYDITITFDTDNGEQTTYAYMYTAGDIVKETRGLMYQKLPEVPQSPMADYYYDFIKTVQWLNEANKLWEHPYGYRRYLDGIKNAHAGLDKLKSSTNPFDGVFPAPAYTKLNRKSISVTSGWKIFDQGKNDDYIKEKFNKLWLLKFNSEPQYVNSAQNSNTINLIIDKGDKELAKEDSYRIEISKKNITIKSASRTGLFYGVSTLIDALTQNTTIPQGIVKDEPALPVRSVIVTVVPVKMNDDFKTYIKKLADLRYNEAYLPGPYLYLEDQANIEKVNEIFDFCNKHFIRPVAYFETFGAGTLTMQIDKCMREGIFHKKEPWEVPANGIIEPGVPEILDCPNTSIHIFTKDGKELKRYEDYKLLRTVKPKILIENPAYRESTLLLSYDAIDFSKFLHSASCPSDPHGWEIMENVLSNVLTILNPDKLHISQDESGGLNKCSRCLARGLSNEDILAEQMGRVYKLIRKYDKDVNLYIWGDQFNDFQNAAVLNAKGAVKGLSKDIKVWDWNYIGVYHSDKMQTINQMNFYFDRGYHTGGVAWFEPANVLDILQNGLKHKDKFFGIMHSAWAKFEQSLYPVAEANWSGKMILEEKR